MSNVLIPSVFIDANILIAGAGSRTGASNAVLLLGEVGLIRLITCKQVIDECERNIKKKLPRAMSEFIKLMTRINIEIMDDPTTQDASRWLPYIETSDASVLESAVKSDATIFITLNWKDFTPEVAKISGLTIQPPSEFIHAVRAIVSNNF